MAIQSLEAYFFNMVGFFIWTILLILYRVVIWYLDYKYVKEDRSEIMAWEIEKGVMVGNSENDIQYLIDIKKIEEYRLQRLPLRKPVTKMFLKISIPSFIFMTFVFGSLWLGGVVNGVQ